MVEANRRDLYKIDPRSVRWDGISFQAALKDGGDGGVYMYMGLIDQPILDYARRLFTRDLAKADEARTILAISGEGHCGLSELVKYQDLALETMDWLQERRGEGLDPLVFGVAVSQKKGEIRYNPGQMGLWQKLEY